MRQFEKYAIYSPENGDCEFIIGIKMGYYYFLFYKGKQDKEWILYDQIHPSFESDQHIYSKLERFHKDDLLEIFEPELFVEVL